MREKIEGAWIELVLSLVSSTITKFQTKFMKFDPLPQKRFKEW